MSGFGVDVFVGSGWSRGIVEIRGDGVVGCWLLLLLESGCGMCGD